MDRTTSLRQAVLAASREHVHGPDALELMCPTRCLGRLGKRQVSERIHLLGVKDLCDARLDRRLGQINVVDTRFRSGCCVGF